MERKRNRGKSWFFGLSALLFMLMIASFGGRSRVLFAAEMETDPVAEMKFEQKLINVGYMDKDVYKNSYFTVSDPEFYKVSDNFPRLTPENVPVQIIKARYEISLASIAEWRVNSELL